MTQNSTKQIENNFRTHDLTNNQTVRCSNLRFEGKKMAILIELNCPNSREKSIAITKLEEAIMWANASIAREEE